MKKLFMITGLALVVGIGIFSLTESRAETIVQTSVVASTSCSIPVPSSCSGSCAGGTTCGATMGGSCSGGSAPLSSIEEVKTAGCGCGKR